ncbi:unnamed protein product [Urochloa humidicola]
MLVQRTTHPTKEQNPFDSRVTAAQESFAPPALASFLSRSFVSLLRPALKRHRVIVREGVASLSPSTGYDSSRCSN